MNETLFVLALASHFTIYPIEGKAPPRVEAITDRGPIDELIIGCRTGTSIITYSKVEKLYCAPKQGCGRDRDAMIARACR